VSLLARYAENLFWLARYIERASSLARIIETHMAYDRGRDEDMSWAWLVQLYSAQQSFDRLYQDTAFKNVIKFYVADLDNPDSIRSSLRAARENGRALRAVIPTEMWIHLNEVYNRFIVISDADLNPIRLSRTCSQIKHGCYAQLGVVESTLYRDEGWQFFLLGLMIERADQTSRLLDVKFAQLATDVALAGRVADATFWALVLRSASAYQAFHRVEQRGSDPNRVAKFLLVNSSHPRSVNHCVERIQIMLRDLDDNYGRRRVNSVQEQSDSMMKVLQLAAADSHLVAHLHGINDELQKRLALLSDGFGFSFFGYPDPTRSAQEQVQA
jgi:uncharacterized alpha-E superfamily protein